MFLGVGVGFVFFGGFLPMFLLHFWRFAPESVWKNSLDVRSAVFWVLSLRLWFFRRRRFSRFFFLRDRDQVVTGHPLTRTGFAGSFSCLCPAAVLFRPFWLCVLLLGGFSGCHSGPRAFLGFSWYLLSPFSWDARRQGFSCASLALFSFSPCVLLCGHTFSRRTGGGLTYPAGTFTWLVVRRAVFLFADFHV